MRNIESLRSLQTRTLNIFDRTMRVLLVGGKGGHILYGAACGMMLSSDVPAFIIAMAFIGGIAGMLYCIIIEGADREH